MQEKKDDSITIKIPKILPNDLVKTMKSNPWTISTLILGVLCLILIVSVFNGGIGGSLSEKKVGQKLVDFYAEQGVSGLTVASVEKVSGIYQVNLMYQGQVVPMHVTKDGKYFGFLDSLEEEQVGGVGTGNVVREVSYEGAPSYGSEDAPVVIMEFLDYRCGYCGRHYSQTYPLIKSNYVDKGLVRYVVRDFAILGPDSEKASEAANCARDQLGDSGYFAMHDAMMNNQQGINVQGLKQMAAGIQGINTATFNTCLDSGKYTSKIKSDVNYGSSLGVSGTPAFFINGRFVNGAVPYSEFEKIIEEELSK